jgi:hypothetical protein
MTATRRSLLRRLAQVALGGVSMAGGLSPSSADAHHGFGGRYDTSRPIWLEGEVVRVRIGMPHSVVSLRVHESLTLPADAGPEAAEFMPSLVLRAEDRGAVREVEFPPVARFLDLGADLLVGHKVAVVALRNCSAPHQLRGQWLRLASGRVVVREGRMQTEVRGCQAPEVSRPLSR